MTELDQPTDVRRRRFRFGLRTLLAVVTLAAVASWAYWIGWPWWLAYEEQARFEADARQLNVYTSESALSEFMYSHHGSCPGLRLNTNGIYYSWSCYKLTYVSYAIKQVYWASPTGEIRDRPLDSIKVFRVPNDKWGKLSEVLMGMPPTETESDAQAELIYSDPPVKPIAK